MIFAQLAHELSLNDICDWLRLKTRAIAAFGSLLGFPNGALPGGNAAQPTPRARHPRVGRVCLAEKNNALATNALRQTARLIRASPDLRPPPEPGDFAKDSQ